MARNPYRVLGVIREATPEQIDAAYRSKARRLHPDAGGDAGKFHKLQEACDLLKDAELRGHYDKTGEWKKQRAKSDHDPELIQTLVMLMTQVAQPISNAGGDPSSVDLIAEMKRVVNGKINESREPLRQGEKVVKQLTKMLGRFRRKDGGDCVLESAVLVQLDHAKQTIAEAERGRDKFKQVYDYLCGCEFVVDKNGNPPAYRALGVFRMGTLKEGW